MLDFGQAYRPGLSSRNSFEAFHILAHSIHPLIKWNVKNFERVVSDSVDEKCSLYTLFGKIDYQLDF